MAVIEGYCDPRFQRVYDLFAANIENGTEVGASFFVNIEGEDVIDLWGGWHDRERTRTWGKHTIVNVFSASKTVTSLAVLMLADRGDVDLEAPVAAYWPEFAQNGKADARVKHLLSHTVGLPAWEPPFSLAEALDPEVSTARLAEALDPEVSTARLAAQAPWWQPGSRGSYHASSFGHLNAELVRRVTGKPIGTFIADEIASPLGADFFLGLSESRFPQVATVYPADEEPRRPTSGSGEPLVDSADPLRVERELSHRTRLGSFSGQKRDPLLLFNSAEWRRATLAGSSGHANARGLGRIMAALSNGGKSQGVQLLSQQTIDRIFEEQFHGIDAYYMKPVRWGIGYALAPLEAPEKGPLPFMRPSPRTCYWYGTGGSLSIADVERRITLTYAMNQCQTGRSSQNGVYYNAFYDSL